MGVLFKTVYAQPILFQILCAHVLIIIQALKVTERTARCQVRVYLFETIFSRGSRDRHTWLNFVAHDPPDVAMRPANA